jgi:hypothetical protein
MKKLLLFGNLLLLGLAGCASGPPEWIDGGKSEAYPASRYLTGIGTGAQPDVAKEHARADLAKLFSYNIGQVAEDVKRHTSKAGSDGARHINEARIERIISDRAEQVLSGTKIAETWRGPETRAYYALAVLPRAQASSNIKREIDRLDNATALYVKRVKDEADVLREIRAANIALDAQVARLAYQRTLRTIDTSEAGVPLKWDVTRLSRDLERVLLRARIAPQVLDDTTGTLTTSTRNALSLSGFQVSDGQSAEFILDTRLNLEKIGYRDKWYWSRGVLQVSLKERASGRERGSVRWTIKAAGQSNSDAEQQIATKADSLLKRQLRDVIVKFATR